MADWVRLLVLVGIAALGGGWVRLTIWSLADWHSGREQGWDRSRSAWKALLFGSQVGFLAQIGTYHVLRWGSAPDLFLPLNLVVTGCGLLATWHLIRDPRRRRTPR